MSAKDTLGGASKGDIAIATTIGVFILLGMIVGFGFFQCYTDDTIACPSLSQLHFDRAFDLILYLGMAGAILVGLRIATNGKNIVPPSIVNSGGGTINVAQPTG